MQRPFIHLLRLLGVVLVLGALSPDASACSPPPGPLHERFGIARAVDRAHCATELVEPDGQRWCTEDPLDTGKVYSFKAYFCLKTQVNGKAGPGGWLYYHFFAHWFSLLLIPAGVFAWWFADRHGRRRRGGRPPELKLQPSLLPVAAALLAWFGLSAWLSSTGGPYTTPERVCDLTTYSMNSAALPLGVAFGVLSLLTYAVGALKGDESAAAWGSTAVIIAGAVCFAVFAVDATPWGICF